MTDTPKQFKDRPNIKKVIVEHANDNAGTGLPASPGFEIWTEDDTPFPTSESKTPTPLVAPQMPKPTAFSNPSTLRGTKSQKSKPTNPFNNPFSNPSITRGTTLDNASHRDEDYSTHVKRYFEDADDMSNEDLEVMKSAFNNNVLNVQVTNTGKTYFNPEGVIYLADLLTVLAKLENFKPDYESMKLDPNAVSPNDYYLDGYLFIRNNIPNLALDRTTLFRPVTLRLLHKMSTGYTDSKLVVIKLKELGLNSDTNDTDKFISILTDVGVLGNNKTADDLLTRMELSRFYNTFTTRKDA